MDRTCPGLILPFIRVAVVLKYTVHVWSGFRQVACAIEDVTRGSWFACRFIGDDAAAEQSLFTASTRSEV